MENIAWICTARAELLFGNGVVGQFCLDMSRNSHNGSHPSFTLYSRSLWGGMTVRTL